MGNPVFDRLLGVAREEGRIGIGYVKPPGGSAEAARGREDRRPVGDLTAGKPEPVYQAVYHFVFTITYPSIEAADEMEVVSVDSGSLDVWAQTADLTELWGGLEMEPRKGRTVIPPVPIPEWAIDAGVRALERRMRRRIKKVEQSCRERLDEETESIRGYYEQLIEEARNQSRRWSTRLEEREERIRFLQLEWKRRIEEAGVFWTPRVNARLVAVGIQMMPRQAVPLLSAPRPPREPPRRPRSRARLRVWDEATRTLLPAFCVACGLTPLEDPRPDGEGGWVCADCEGKVAWKVRGGGGEPTDPP